MFHDERLFTLFDWTHLCLEMNVNTEKSDLMRYVNFLDTHKLRLYIGWQVGSKPDYRLPFGALYPLIRICSSPMTDFMRAFTGIDHMINSKRVV